MKSALTVAHIVSTYPPYKGGMGNVAWQMVHELRKIGHNAEVLTPLLDGGSVSDEQEQVHRLKPVFSFRNSAFVPSIYKRLKSYDLIHLHYPFYGGAELVALHRLLHKKIPLVSSYHMDVEGKGLVRAFFQAYKYTCAPVILGASDKIIVSSLDYAEDSSYLLSHRDKLVELPFGIPEAFSRPIEIIREEVSDRFDMLFVAALDASHYFKGLDILLQAIASLPKEYYVKLNVVGDGELKEYYETQAKALGIQDKVEFEGRVNDEDLKKMYTYSNVTLLPSLDRSESFGLVLAESMACGTPVIASRLPGVRSLVDHSQTGFLVKPGDINDLAQAIMYMHDNRARVKRMGENGAVMIDEEYRWPVIIKKLETLYQEVLANKK